MASSAIPIKRPDQSLGLHQATESSFAMKQPLHCHANSASPQSSSNAWRLPSSQASSFNTSMSSPSRSKVQSKVAAFVQRFEQSSVKTNASSPPRNVQHMPSPNNSPPFERREDQTTPLVSITPTSLTLPKPCSIKNIKPPPSTLQEPPPIAPPETDFHPSVLLQPSSHIPDLPESIGRIYGEAAAKLEKDIMKTMKRFFQKDRTMLKEFKTNARLFGSDSIEAEAYIESLCHQLGGIRMLQLIPCLVCVQPDELKRGKLLLAAKTYRLHHLENLEQQHRRKSDPNVDLYASTTSSVSTASMSSDSTYNPNDDMQLSDFYGSPPKQTTARKQMMDEDGINAANLFGESMTSSTAGSPSKLQTPPVSPAPSSQLLFGNESDFESDSE